MNRRNEEEEIENSFDFIIRNPEYKKEIYQIKEEIKQNEDLYKLYGYNKERNLNIVITKVKNISVKDNPNFLNRLLITTKLIEENKLLVENLWLEKNKNTNYNLYVSELTNTIYRNEYNLITLNNYMISTKNTYKDNIQILISIIKTIKYFQKYNFSHCNIHPNNIYINTKKNNLIYFGPPKIVSNYINDSTYLWYSSPEENFIEKDLGFNNDIWSIGCIICELFFINFPLFQSYSPNEKIIKIFDILGFPSYDDVFYINKYQYDSLHKRCSNHSKDNNLFNLLLSPKEKKTNLYNFKVELVNIIKGCLEYNINKRLKLETILNKLEYLNNNIASEFHSQILETINLTEESESNYSNNKNNFSKNNLNKINIINNNKSIESEEFKNLRIDNNINININENNYPSIIIKKENSKVTNITEIKNILNKDKNDKNKNINELEIDDIKYKNNSEKKENNKDYFKELKNNMDKETDEFKELNQSKYNKINNNLNVYRN